MGFCINVKKEHANILLKKTKQKIKAEIRAFAILIIKNLLSKWIKLLSEINDETLGLECRLIAVTTVESSWQM